MKSNNPNFKNPKNFKNKVPDKIDNNNNQNTHIIESNKSNINNNKKKNKKYIQQQIKEEYANFIESQNNNEIIDVKSIENLVLLNESIKSKSSNNSNKINEMKDIIRKNSSCNLIKDIVLEINPNNELSIQQVKIKSSNSLANINKYEYLLGDDCIDLEEENKNSNTLNNRKKIQHDYGV